jgi:hypothetical protein
MAASLHRPSPAVSVGDADTAVLAGRLGCDLRADPLTLYTVISAEAWATLQRDGVLTGREDLADPAFIEAYTWMRSAAARHGLGDTWPVWLWAKTTRYELVNQVMHDARHQPGSVLITARIPRSRLLLSEFQAWHCVLNQISVSGRTPPTPTSTRTTAPSRPARTSRSQTLGS